jgi:triphosphoribosyl-dephospho-CoA synthase
MPDIGLCVQTACVWEASARKPGNVHRYRDFADLSYLDLLLSAAAIAPVLAAAPTARVGAIVLEAVRATRAVAQSNSNLGIILLLTPLAAVPEGEDLRRGVERVLEALDVEDARLAYEAIRLARPGGLGRAQEEDVAGEPTRTLREVMALAAGRDLVARQYTDGFREVFEEGAPALVRGMQETGSVEGGIVSAHLFLLSRHPDSLIARKHDDAEAEEASARAGEVLRLGWPAEGGGRSALARLDAWLRQGRNPGTTADLVCASLFVLLREGTMGLRPDIPWPCRFLDHD